MIAKLNFVSITGPREDIDRIVEKYLSKYEIHLEYAPSELKTVSSLHPYVETNMYKEHLIQIEELVKYMGAPDEKKVLQNDQDDMKVADAARCVSELYKSLGDIKNKIAEIEKEKEIVYEHQKKLQNFVNLDKNITDILSYKHVKYRFGRIPKDYFAKFEDYAYESIESIFIKCSDDEDYVWGVYFVPVSERKSVDAVYASLHFERTYSPDKVEGTAGEQYERYQLELDKLNSRIDALNNELKESFESKTEEFYKAYNVLKKYAKNFDIRKYAACTSEEGISYYILCGWMDEANSKSLQSDLDKNEPDTICIIDDKHETVDVKPPTKLKNWGLFRPFEMYIKMYGLPAYNELDPTVFVALTYAFIFGAMFGDVGQGLLLFIGGFLLYKFKKINLAAIISCAGIFSTFFGFMFGSVFGFEDILEAVWLHPAKAMIDVPFIGKLNTVFIVAIGFGMILILITMIMNIVNSIKSHDKEKLLFDTNGFAGLVFYGSLTAVLALFMADMPLPATIILVVMFVIPLILIALKEPLTNLVEKKAKLIEGGMGMFFVQTFFEMFEVLLSYFSNTLSFVRVGAFAVSHAAMMEVVLMLAGAENGNPGNMVVIVLGNLFVCGLEGLIVGIQVLRLEYYEMFSRFYKGTGREFKPYNTNDV